jgi:hypothetical protein
MAVSNGVNQERIKFNRNRIMLHNKEGFNNAVTLMDLNQAVMAWLKSESQLKPVT